MPQDPSSSSADHPDEDDLPDVPRTTELLLKLRNQDRKAPRWLMIVCLLNLTLAGGCLVVSGEKALPLVTSLVVTALAVFFSERLDRQSKRDQMTFELLIELVAENNQLRGLVPAPSKEVK